MNKKETEEFRGRWTSYIEDLQDSICTAVERADGYAFFMEDQWSRKADGEGGGGRTRVMSNGHVFEKAGVNTSVVHGRVSDLMRKDLRMAGEQWFACGLSVVIHPMNPFVPAVHCNYRYFELYQQEEVIDRWFGGGTDLTPNYLIEEDARYFHQTYKKIADSFSKDLYAPLKKECDDYFVNRHRGQERRGVGGIFYEQRRPDQLHDLEFWDSFGKACGNAFVGSYLPIVLKRKDMPFSDHHKHWQQIRRGRYVEFNLVHDKGTLFGLKTNGRIQSILMSLPPTVRFEYNDEPAPNSPEAALVEVCCNPRDWADE